ncbi:hypothetical protein BJY59DRAFT_693585 [Rhodotorula toruloides]
MITSLVVCAWVDRAHACQGIGSAASVVPSFEQEATLCSRSRGGAVLPSGLRVPVDRVCRVVRGDGRGGSDS